MAPDTGNEGRKYRDRRDVGTGYEGRGVPGLKGENSLKSAVKLDTCKPVKHIQSLLDKEHKHGARCDIKVIDPVAVFYLLGKEP